MKNNRFLALFLAIILILGTFAGCGNTTYEKISPTDVSLTETTTDTLFEIKTVYEEGFSLSDVPEYSGKAYCELNSNVPYFYTDKFSLSAIYNQFDVAYTIGNYSSFEYYNKLDTLGRTTWAFACIGRDLMPTEERGDISAVHPTGWVGNKYQIKNRCHIIGFQLAGENDNERNLFTGTRYLNVVGMLPFENQVASYVKSSGGHVLYRVTPVFDGNNLLASGVLMEALSCEDSGKSVQYCVYCYNIQDGYKLDYKTGYETKTSQSSVSTTVPAEQTGEGESAYIINISTKKIHNSDCSYAQNIAEKNKMEYDGDINDLYKQGYVACQSCNPK